MLKTAAGNAVSAAEESKRRNIRYHSLTALYQKEMADHVTSKRFIIILILVIAMTIASVYSETVYDKRQLHTIVYVADRIGRAFYRAYSWI